MFSILTHVYMKPVRDTKSEPGLPVFILERSRILFTTNGKRQTNCGQMQVQKFLKIGYEKIKPVQNNSYG